MSDNLRNMADHLEKRHREYHSAPVLEMAVIAMRNGADRIEELEVAVEWRRGRAETAEANLDDKEAECRFLRGECNMLKARLAKALETLEYFSNGKHIRGDTPADACQWVINHARATIEELKGQDQ